jgi:hypothetical protein
VGRHVAGVRTLIRQHVKEQPQQVVRVLPAGTAGSESVFTWVLRVVLSGFKWFLGFLGLF